MAELKVLFRDKHIIAVYKPAGVGVGSDSSNQTTLLEMVRDLYSESVAEGKKGYCVPIHFLDKPVTGVILFATSSKAAARLNKLFKDRKVTKTYLALVHGKPTEVTDVKLEHYLAKDRQSNHTRVVSPDHPDGKFCRLTYSIVADYGDFSLLRVRPETGRSHQIRVQLATVGCPILGDQRYGSSMEWHSRIGLHASSIEFVHPVTKEPVKIDAPLPEHWSKQIGVESIEF